MAKVGRFVLWLVVAVVAAAAWGFVTVGLGAPTVVVSLGAMLIGGGILAYGAERNSN